jgi:hypothetical protein
VRPIPFARRRGFLDAMLAELIAAGAHNPGVSSGRSATGCRLDSWERLRSSASTIATDRNPESTIDAVQAPARFTGYM